VKTRRAAPPRRDPPVFGCESVPSISPNSPDLGELRMFWGDDDRTYSDLRYTHGYTGLPGGSQPQLLPEHQHGQNMAKSLSNAPSAFTIERPLESLRNWLFWPETAVSKI
jgi:hypothetical protein